MQEISLVWSVLVINSSQLYTVKWGKNKVSQNTAFQIQATQICTFEELYGNLDLYLF